MSVSFRPSSSCHLSQGGLLTVKSLDRASKEIGPTASATKCLVGRSVSEAFRFRPCLALKTEFSAGGRRGMRFGTRYLSVVDQVEASTTGFICASPVGLLIPFLVQAVSASWIPFLDPVVRPGINAIVEVI